MFRVIDELVDPLGDSFSGDTVAIQAVKAGRVDRNFRRNYAWAKYAADRGRLSKVTVVVSVDGVPAARTAQAVLSAVSGTRLHPVASFYVKSDASDIALAGKVLDALADLQPVAPVEAPGEAPEGNDTPEAVEPAVVEDGGQEDVVAAEAGYESLLNEALATLDASTGSELGGPRRRRKNKGVADGSDSGP